MDTEVQDESIWVRRGEAAGWSLLCCFVAVAFCAAIPQDGRTYEGFLIQLLAALSGYLAVRRWRGSPRLRDSVRYFWLVRHWLECLLALIVALMLAAILYPVFARPHVGSGHARSTASKLKRNGLSLLVYQEDHGGRMPPMPDRATLLRALEPYGPSDRNAWSSAENEGHEPFWINTAVGGRTTDELGEGWENIPFAWTNCLDASRFSRIGRYVCFLDSRVRFVSEEEWYRIRPRTGQIPIKNHRPRQASQPASQAIHP